MAAPQVAFVCRASTASTTTVSTVTVCWCDVRLTELVTQGKLESTLTEGASGDDVRALLEHLVCFNFDLELMKASKNTAPAKSDDLTNNKWGRYVTRALRMFALHPKVGAETEQILASDGKKLTAPLVEKLRGWCRGGLRSPKNYWEYPQLKLDGTRSCVDAFGEDLGNGTQSVPHHFIRQIQEDLASLGFGLHAGCSLCNVPRKVSPSGKYESGVAKDTQLRDLEYMVNKFQRQARWLWRMDAKGQHLTDVLPGDPTVFLRREDGVMDQETARVLRAWVDKGLHMVLNKFELKELHWPPNGTTPIQSESGPAKLRRDAYDAWLAAARVIHDKGGTLGTRFASSPRTWKPGKLSSSKGNSPFSWHYSALAVDIDQAPASGDGTVSKNFRFVLEEDGIKFRIWCYADPQPAVPANPADDTKDPYLQYRNRNIATKSVAPGKLIDSKLPADPNPLFHQCNPTSGFKKVAAPKGWYVDISRILEDNGVMRVQRHADWKTNAKGWEWWHYQFDPGLPPGITPLSVTSSPPNKKYKGQQDPGLPTFGDCVQLYGIHEYHLRNLADGWVEHEDLEHRPG
jgi:hypothetical protein